MNLALKPKLAEFVESQVKAGRYASADDVVAAGLTRLMQDDGDDFKPGELSSLVEEGEQAILRGDTVTMGELREHFRLRYAQHPSRQAQAGDSPPTRTP